MAHRAIRWTYRDFGVEVFSNGGKAMTEAKMKRCEGSGQKVYGEDEPDGTVFCSKCGTSGLRMVTAVVDGKKQYSVPEHKRRANPPRPRAAKKAPKPRGGGGRHSGRRR